MLTSVLSVRPTPRAFSVLHWAPLVHRHILLTAVLVVAAVLPTSAQPGHLDPAFSGDGKMSFDGGLFGGNRNDAITDSALQIDDKVVLVGYAEFSLPDTDILIARVNANGELDTTFAGDGIYTEAKDEGGTLQDTAISVAILDDGRILVGGWSASDAELGYWLRRLNPDGSIDATFFGDAVVYEAGFDLSVNAIVIEPSGTFLVLVRAIASGVGHERVYRYSADGVSRTLVGTLDPEYTLFDMVRLPDGTIWLSGRYDHPAGDDDFAAARIVGTTVSAFFHAVDLGTSTANNDDVALSLVMQGDQPVLVGCAGHDNGRAAVAMRLHSNGNRDLGFGDSGVANLLQVNGVDACFRAGVIHDDKMLFAGSGGNLATNDLQFVYRVDADGATDSTFGSNGFTSWEYDLGGSNDDATTSMHIDTLDRILVSGVAATVHGNNDATVTRLVQELFADGFESGNLSAWSSTSP